MKTLSVLSASALFTLLPVGVALAAGHGPTHSLEVVEQTKTLLADLAYYAKYLLPTVAILFAIYGGLQRAMSGDDDMKKIRADRTLANAKMGLVLGFIAAPLLHWIQRYYQN